MCAGGNGQTIEGSETGADKLREKKKREGRQKAYRNENEWKEYKAYSYCGYQQSQKDKVEIKERKNNSKELEGIQRGGKQRVGNVFIFEILKNKHKNIRKKQMCENLIQGWREVEEGIREINGDGQR